MPGGGGPFSRRRHGRDHECHLSRTLRRDRHSLRSRLWDRHRLGFCICCHARHLESSSTGANEESSQQCEWPQSHHCFSRCVRSKGTSVERRNDSCRSSRRPHRSCTGDPTLRLRGRPRLHSDRDHRCEWRSPTQPGAVRSLGTASPIRSRAACAANVSKSSSFSFPALPASQTRGFHTWGERIA